jgi:protein TonB
MAMQLSFRQACIVSLTIHLLLVPGMGWLAGGWLKSEPASQLIEIELVAGGSGPGSGMAAAAAMPFSQAAQSPLPTLPVLPSEPEPVTDENITAAPATSSVFIPQSQSGIDSGSVNAASSGLGHGQGGGGGSGDGSELGSGSGTGTGSGSGSGTAQSVLLPPQVLKRFEPEYPMSARRANQEGVVGLRIEIQANGLPGAISVARSSGYEALDDAAEAAVRNWRFVPARDSQSGAPVASVTVLSVAFRLR